MVQKAKVVQKAKISKWSKIVLGAKMLKNTKMVQNIQKYDPKVPKYKCVNYVMRNSKCSKSNYFVHCALTDWAPFGEVEGYFLTFFMRMRAISMLLPSKEWNADCSDFKLRNILWVCGFEKSPPWLLRIPKSMSIQNQLWN